MQDSDKLEIEKTTYLASLVSDPLAVDPILDKIRFITARGESVQLTEADRREVATAQRDLENYLINQEKVSSFTKETLHQKLTMRFSREYQNTKKTLRRQLAITLILPFFVAPIVFGALSSFGRELQLVSAIPAFLSTQYAGLLWFFWSARKSLVATLQRSLAFTLASLVILVGGGITFVILAFIPDTAQHPLFRYGGPLPLYTPGFFLLYYGAYTYAKQIGITANIWVQAKAVIAAALVVYFAIWLIPHDSHVTQEIFFDASISSFGMGAFLCAASAALMFRVASQVTKRYISGLRYMAIAFAIMAVANIGIALSAFLAGVAPVGSTEIFPIYIVGGIGYSAAFVLLYMSAYTLKLRLID